jgi:5'-3' exonuclease
MGIPSYFSYIVKNHINIITKFSNIHFPINNFYLDCNSIIYDIIHRTNFKEITENETDHIINNILLQIDDYIHIIKPTNNLLIAFDGVAPVAKLNQQRERRYKSHFQQKISKSILKKSNDWNTAAITPGTFFMNKLNEKVTKYFNNPDKYNLQKIIISTSNLYGEGEHKIFNYIRENKAEHSDFTTVVYGLDADLIMLCINHLPICSKLYLFRETPEFIKSISSELEPNEQYLLDIPELACKLPFYQSSPFASFKVEELDLAQPFLKVVDYVFICFFLGNDFLPHFPSVNIRTGGVDKMLNAYKEVIKDENDLLTDGRTIYWKNVRKLVQFLSTNEELNLQNEMKLRNRREKYKLPNTTPEDKYKNFDNIPTYERELEFVIDPFKPNWQTRYYQTLFTNITTEEDIKKICINYLEGLEWTIKYYTSGCPNWSWYYKYPYPPLFCDLIKYVPYFETELVPYVDPNPVNELVQLSYVLPKDSLHLLPDKLRHLLLEKYSHWYSNDCEFIWAFCKYFWEAHVLLPEIDINELKEVIHSFLKKK